MGLDMYLEGRKYLVTDWENDANNPKEDGFQVKERILQLGYWRKHPNLHGYIVQTFAGGKDECQDIGLSAENLDTIITAIKGRGLPHTEGFFFGKSDCTDEEAAADIKILEDAKTWLKAKEDRVWRSVVYRASW